VKKISHASTKLHIRWGRYFTMIVYVHSTHSGFIGHAPSV